MMRGIWFAALCEPEVRFRNVTFCSVMSETSVDKQIRRLTLNRVGYTDNVKERDIPLSPFELSHMGSVYSGVVSESFLRQS
jgi:hypothetical protein